MKYSSIQNNTLILPYIRDIRGFCSFKNISVEEDLQTEDVQTEDVQTDRVQCLSNINVEISEG
jgi:hypothetical protein